MKIRRLALAIGLSAAISFISTSYASTSQPAKDNLNAQNAIHKAGFSKTDEEKLIFDVSFITTKQIAANPIMLQLFKQNETMISKGIEAALNSDAPPKDLNQKTIRELKNKLSTAQKLYLEKIGEEKKAANEKYLANLKQNKEWTAKKADGSTYYIRTLTPGKGASPSATDSVTVNYEGKLIDGTVFDSSFKKGEPVTFSLNSVVKGWTAALQNMKVGGEYEIVLPPKLAYGKKGLSSIAPNSILIFKIDLISIKRDKSQGDK